MKLAHVFSLPVDFWSALFNDPVRFWDYIALVMNEYGAVVEW